MASVKPAFILLDEADNAVNGPQKRGSYAAQPNFWPSGTVMPRALGLPVAVRNPRDQAADARGQVFRRERSGEGFERFSWCIDHGRLPHKRVQDKDDDTLVGELTVLVDELDPKSQR